MSMLIITVVLGIGVFAWVLHVNRQDLQEIYHELKAMDHDSLVVSDSAASDHSSV
ncbi:MAG: hypothetical protein G8237_09080 [Magnetococcales bacterium]|nr:hypothetical protein [Magnetococcales bacterium]NGZ06498.1 hypothetical protein [Magnetococcales bacterium]